MAPAASYSGEHDAPDANASLPLVSLEPLLKASSTTADTAATLLSAFRKEGFLYVTDFSDIIPLHLIETVFSSSARFFERPLEEKNAIAWTTARANRGYTGQGQEKTTQATTKEEVTRIRESSGEDIKESLEIGRDDEEGFSNRWPEDGNEESAAFKKLMQDFFQRCHVILEVLMKGIAIGMSLDENFFDPFMRNKDNTLRLLHYQQVAPGGFEGGKRVRAGAHTDYGSLTLLFQDKKGGLQVEQTGGSWLDVTPIDGTIVVNAGDLLARWSNDSIRSTLHRVVQPPAEQYDAGHPPRYSVAYFGNPDFDRLIEALPGTWGGEKGGKIYDPVNSGQYLEQRLSATY